MFKKASVVVNAVVMLLFLSVKVVMSAPAIPDPITITQPNGLCFSVYLSGDEFGVQVETQDGYTVLQNPKTSAWEYAEMDVDGRLIPSGTMVDPHYSPPQSIERHLRPDVSSPLDSLESESVEEPGMELYSAGTGGIIWPQDWTPQPTIGTRKLLVILVQFSNRTLSTTAANWHSRFFDTTSGALSLVNYYKDNSFNALTVQPLAHTQSGNPTGVVTVTLNRVHPDTTTSSLAMDVTWMPAALAAASNYVNFAALDTDSDGWIETDELNIYFIPAGFSYGSSLTHPYYPAHMGWSESPNLLSVQGKTIEKWAVAGEMMTVGSTNYQHTLGVLVHELGHAMCGFPDLYDRIYDSTQGASGNLGLGRFSVMSRGCWGMAYATGSLRGACPTATDAWSRIYAGWSTPRIPTDTQVMTFSGDGALGSQNEPIKLTIPGYANEYYLVETRTNWYGWDLGTRYYLSSGGVADDFDWKESNGDISFGSRMLILHVDESVGTPKGFDINDTKSGRQFQGVVAEEMRTADPATPSIMTSLTDRTKTLSNGKWYHLFGVGDKFNDYDTPNAILHGGSYSNIGIYDPVLNPHYGFPTIYSAMIVPSSHLDIPQITPSGGYVSADSTTVTITKKTSGSTIKYTTDGSDPSSSITALTYSSSFALPLNAAGKTVKARVFKTGYTTSPLSSATYIRNYAPTVVSTSPSSGNVTNSVWTTYSCTYSDLNTAADIEWVYFAVKEQGVFSETIFLYNKLDNLLWIYTVANGWTPTAGVTRGTSQILENTNAFLDCGNTTVTSSGNNLTINWRVKFKPDMAGKTYSIGHNVQDIHGSSTGSSWYYLGTTTVL